jgi:hypothetical protein
MFDRHIQRIKEGFQRRREAIDEINFTYAHLLKLLQAMFRRVDPEVLGPALREQQLVDRAQKDQLAAVAMEYGQPPGPCVCAEPAALVEAVYNADRSTVSSSRRAGAIVRALKAVRVFLIHAWGRLIDALPVGTYPRFAESARRMQHREADQHRSLVELGRRLEEDGQPGTAARS